MLWCCHENCLTAPWRFGGCGSWEETVGNNNAKIFAKVVLVTYRDPRRDPSNALEAIPWQNTELQGYCVYPRQDDSTKQRPY